MKPLTMLFLPGRTLVNGECVAHCSPVLDVAWVALYVLAVIGVGSVVYEGWRWWRRP